MKECRNHVNLQPLTESQKASHWQTKQTLPRESKSQEEKPSPLAVGQSFLRDAWDSTFRSVTEEGGISQPELNIPSLLQPIPTVMANICQPVPAH